MLSRLDATLEGVDAEEVTNVRGVKETLLRDRDSLLDQQTKVLDYLKATKVEGNKDHVALADRQINEIVNSYLKRVIQFIATMPSETPASKPDSKSSAAKPNTALKPDKLQLDHTPVELANWKRRFEAFYRTSRLEVEKIEDQREYLNSCLDSVVCQILEAKAPNRLPLFSAAAQEKTCFTVLKDLWLTRYPLYQRRHAYFTTRFKGGHKSVREIPAFLSQIEELGRTAEIDKMSPSAINAFRALSEIEDKELRKACWKEEDLDMTKFRLLALARVREYENFASFKSDAASTSYAREAAEVRLALKDVICFTCQGKGHYSTDCPHKGKKVVKPKAYAATESLVEDASGSDDDDPAGNEDEDQPPPQDDAAVLAAKKGKGGKKGKKSSSKKKEAKARVIAEAGKAANEKRNDDDQNDNGNHANQSEVSRVLSCYSNGE